MTCPNCGNELPDGAKFCDKCGAQMGAPEPQQAAPEQPQYQTPPQPEQPQPEQPQYQAQQQYQYNQPQQNPGGGLGIAGLVLGIVGIVFAFIFPPIGLACAIVGLVLSVMARNRSRAVGMPYSMATAGMVLSIIVLVLNVILLIACVACVGMAGSALNSLM